MGVAVPVQIYVPVQSDIREELVKMVRIIRIC